MSVSGLSYSIGQAPLDGLDTIYTNYINTDSIDINSSLNGMPITYFTGTTSNLQDQINDITGQIAGQTGNWGAFTCSSTLNNPTANVARYAYVDAADPSGIGISLHSPAGGGLYQAIQVDEAGVYNLQFSCQFTHSSSSKHDVWIWFRKNGSDVPNSASKLSMLSNDQNQVPAWNFIFDLSGGDYVSVMWSSDTTQTSLPAIAAQSTPVVIPAIPSVIITMQQITNLAAGPQGPAGITPNLAVGTVQSTPYGNAPQVTITGTSTNPLLNFVLETGQQGPQGERGPRGEKGETGGLDPADLAIVEAAATTAGAAAGGAAGASAGADAGAAAGAAAASALITPLEGEIATLQGQVTTIEGDITTINTDLTELQEKTSNISAVPGVSTTITGTDGLYVDDITTLAITSPDVLEIVSTTSTAITSSGAIEVATTSTLTLGGGTFSTLQSDTETSILAPIININSGASTGTINIGESLLDTVYIQGLPFVNFNLNPFSQW
jgi:hypothetical protein